MLSRLIEKFKIQRKSNRISETYPEIYHYTDLKGLKGIIASRTIWAIKYDHLNDLEEMRCFEKVLMKHCKNAVADVIRGLKRDEKQLSERFPDGDYVSGIAKLSSSILCDSLLKDDEPTDPYIASFCSVDRDDEYVRKNGLLSQWRGYGSDGGYALVFDTRTIEGLIESERYAIVGASKNNSMLQIGKAVYSDKDVHKNFSKEMDVLKEFVRWMTEAWFTDPNVVHQTFNKKIVLKMRDEYLPAFMRCMPLCKHQGFKEEKEIRIVAFLAPEKYFKGLSTPRKEIIASPKPHMELFSKPKISDKVKIRYPKDYLGIKRIIIGPIEDKERRKSELKEFLESARIEVEITVSETPFIKR